MAEVLTTFLPSVTKCLTQSYLRAERFILALSLKGCSPQWRGRCGNGGSMVAEEYLAHTSADKEAEMGMFKSHQVFFPSLFLFHPPA